VLKNGAEYGMYERVEGKFYNNRGTDVFSGEGIVSHEFNSIYLGSDIEATAPFRVTNTGKLFAAGATISGNISADSGTIGGFSLSETTFKTLRNDDFSAYAYDNPDLLITTRGSSQ
jgi:hypothetical protein